MVPIYSKSKSKILKYLASFQREGIFFLINKSFVPTFLNNNARKSTVHWENLNSAVKAFHLLSKMNGGGHQTTLMWFKRISLIPLIIIFTPSKSVSP
jgi:hypothetical protein